MFLSLFSKKSKKQIFGLDIGTQNTRLMSFEGDKPLVNNFLMTATPSKVFEAGLISDETAYRSLLVSR